MITQVQHMLHYAQGNLELLYTFVGNTR
jgi:hypothetical protein